jgi:hypothetical protein
MPAVRHEVLRLLRMSQEELDRLFREGEPGPIPDGRAEGTLIVAPGTALSPPIAGLVRLLAWQGKVFDARRSVLTNRVLPLGLHAVVAQVRQEPSWLDGKACIVLDYARTSLVARAIRDELRRIGPGQYLGRAYWHRIHAVDFVLEF